MTKKRSSHLTLNIESKLDAAPAKIVAHKDDDDWRVVRSRIGVGASEVPSLFGLGGPSVSELLLSKRMGASMEPTPSSEEMRLGNALEKTVIEEYAQYHSPNSKIVLNSQTFQSTIFEHLFATPDAFEQPPDGSLRLVQIKCTGRGWRWADGIPAETQIQMQTEMAVMGAAINTGVVFSGMRVQHSVLERDERMIGEIASMVERFWKLVSNNDEFVDSDWISGTAGERRALDKLSLEARSDIVTTKTLPDPIWLERLAEADRMRDIIKRATDKKSLIENRILAEAAGAHIVKFADGRVCKLTPVSVPERTVSAYSYLRLTMPRTKEGR